MGYSTRFEGEIRIDPDPSGQLIARANRWCENFEGAGGIWTRHCDWRVVPHHDGTFIEWNGSEKSYDMDKLLPILIDRFFPRSKFVLNGTVTAAGEEAGDVWSLVVEDNAVRRIDGIHMDNKSWSNGGIALSRTKDGRGIIVVPTGDGRIEDVRSDGTSVTLKLVKGNA